MSALKLSEIKVGDQFHLTTGPIDRETIKNYADASGDKNPIHINEEFAEKVGLKGVIAHGMLSFGHVARFISDLAGDGKVIRLGCELRGMVRPGDEYLMTATVKEINGNRVRLDIIQESKTKIRIEKDGKVVKTFEAEEKGWITDKDREKGLIKTEETEEGTLYFRQRLSIKAYAEIELPE